MPHTGSWSLCVCVCAWACLPSSASTETDGPWHLPFGRFSLWKMSSSLDPTCMCVCICVNEGEIWHIWILLPEVKLCSWLNNGSKQFEQPRQRNLASVVYMCVLHVYISVCIYSIHHSLIHTHQNLEVCVGHALMRESKVKITHICPDRLCVCRGGGGGVFLFNTNRNVGNGEAS